MKALLAFATCLVIVALSAHSPTTFAGGHQSPLVPRSEWVHALGAAYQSLIADYYWVQTTHQAGEAITVEDYRDIYDYARMTTELDPTFRYPYTFAGAVIPCNLGADRWANTAESTDILERGFKVFPDYVYIRILLAYNWSFYDKNFVRAARLLDETSRMPGAPDYLSQLATRLYAQGGDIDSGMALARTLEAASNDPVTREAFGTRVKELELERELQAVDHASSRFQRREGHLPKDIGELVRARDLDHSPSDPFEGIIYLAPDGRAHSTALEHRLESYVP